MGLRLTIPDGEIDDPTDHPHVYEDSHFPIDADDDVTYYSISLKGADAAVAFFRAMFVQRLDDDLYSGAETGEMRNFSLFGIPDQHISHVLDVFNTIAEDIESVQIVGKVNGDDYSMEVWDGEVETGDELYPKL